MLMGSIVGCVVGNEPACVAAGCGAAEGTRSGWIGGRILRNTTEYCGYYGKVAGTFEGR